MDKLPVLVMGGRAYADIDVLACASAYKQFLELQGIKAEALITGPWNQTIPPCVRAWDIEIESVFKERDCSFVLVDFSNPDYVDSFVKLDQVIEVFDHHYGYEAFWKERIGDKAQIESIGACATLIWEKFKVAKCQDKISTVNANLLYTAIFANTLNFKSAVTKKRDLDAAKELLEFTNLPKNWKEIYYREVEESFLQNDFNKILEDTKIITFQNKDFRFGQVELFHAKAFLALAKNELDNFSQNQNERWIINIVSIEEGCSYLFCNCKETKEQLKQITSTIDSEFISDYPELVITPRMWLRKELLKEMMILTNA